MKALSIKDLSRNEELDGKAMAGVSGGHGFAPWYGYGYSDSSTKNFSFDAMQQINQGA